MYKGDYFNNEFKIPDKKDEVWSICSPANQDDKVIELHSSVEHVELVCEAAKKAFHPWARLSHDKRKEYLVKLKEVYERRADDMAELISRETGKPLWEAKTEAKALAAKIKVTTEHSYQLVEEVRVPEAAPGVEGVIRNKPRGVMAVIGPFNFPAHLPNGHIIPALLMGNTVVFKPSDKTPGVGQLMAEFYAEAGFPPGVFNLIQGQAQVASRLTKSQFVDGILFTGSYDVGQRIKQDTIDHYWKILALEMGGKNSTVVWEDADLEKAVYETLVGCFMTTGQRCSCTSKLILHEKIRDKFLENFVEATRKLKVGHWSQDPFMGPLISEASKESYLKFQDIAGREGAKTLLAGETLSLEKKGNYVSPSIHLVERPKSDSVYQQSEIFGPNVAVYTVSDYEESMKIVNSGGYGLVMALFTKQRELYEKALLDAKVGLLNLNRTTNGASSRLPFGGMGKSGNDRPSGHFAINYCVVPVASLEDPTSFDSEKLLPGMEYNFS